MSVLTEPQMVIEHLRNAGKSLSLAHEWAGEEEGDQTNLVGPVRDLLFGLNSSVDALVQMVDEGRFGRRNSERAVYRCVRCGIPATDQAESIVQPGVLLTVHLPMTDDEGRTVEWCRQHGGPAKPLVTGAGDERRREGTNHDR